MFNFRPNSISLHSKGFTYDDEGSKIQAPPTENNLLISTSCDIQPLSGQYTLRRYGLDESDIAYLILADTINLTKDQIKTALIIDTDSSEQFLVFRVDRWSQHDEIIVKEVT